MHTNELPSDSSTGRDQHAAAENATFMGSEKHEKTQRTAKQEDFSEQAAFTVAADDSGNWKPRVKIFGLLEESLSLRRAAVNQTGDVSFCWDKNTEKLANTSWPQIGI